MRENERGRKKRWLSSAKSDAYAGVLLSIQKGIASKGKHSEYESVFDSVALFGLALCLGWTHPSNVQLTALGAETCLELRIAVLFSIAAFVVASIMNVTTSGKTGKCGVFEAKAIASASVFRRHVIETTKSSA